MRNIPKDPLPDSTLALYFEGYEFISNRCRRFNSDLFQTRLLLRKAICMRGEEAARSFTIPASSSGKAPSRAGLSNHLSARAAYKLSTTKIITRGR